LTIDVQIIHEIVYHSAVVETKWSQIFREYTTAWNQTKQVSWAIAKMTARCVL